MLKTYRIDTHTDKMEKGGKVVFRVAKEIDLKHSAAMALSRYHDPVTQGNPQTSL